VNGRTWCCPGEPRRQHRSCGPALGHRGAALTAGVNGARAVAVSLDVPVRPESPPHWETAAAAIRTLLPFVAGCDPGTVLNVNVPDAEEARPPRWARLATYGRVRTKVTRLADGGTEVGDVEVAGRLEPGTRRRARRRGTCHRDRAALRPRGRGTDAAGNAHRGRMTGAPALFVLMGGWPGSGKSTLAAALGPRLGLPVLAKDEVKEALADGLGWPETVGESQRLGRASVLVVLRMARRCPGAVLDSAWFDYTRPHVATLPGRVVEVRCVVPVEVARSRYYARAAGRHASHHDLERDEDELWGEPGAAAGCRSGGRGSDQRPAGYSDGRRRHSPRGQRAGIARYRRGLRLWSRQVLCPADRCHGQPLGQGPAIRSARSCGVGDDVIDPADARGQPRRRPWRCRGRR
jgi:predicted kinase